jgi:multicomponent Na+:H+ antiporter subunit D
VTLDQHLPALAVAVPLLAAPVVTLLRVPRLPWLAATAVSALAFAVALQIALTVAGGADFEYRMGGWPAPFGITLRVDAFSALMLLIVAGASLVALLAGRTSLEADVEAERAPLFYTAWLLALAGLSGIVVTGDAFNVFVFMEISSLATYILVASGRDRRSLMAAYQYLIMGTIGATFYLIGVALLYMSTGTLDLADLESRLAGLAGSTPLLIASGFITVGLCLKAAVFPMHGWLPKAYGYAPNVVTVFLAACSAKVALYLLLRMDFSLFHHQLAGHEWMLTSFLRPLAVLALILASISAIQERDLKRMLAYSSIAQVGYILLGASFLDLAGVTGAVVHLFNHALAKGAAFLAVVALGLHLGVLDLERLRGSARRMPLAFGAFVIAGLSLIGVPGTAGFVTKYYLILAALDAGTTGLVLLVAVLASSLLAVIYVWRVVEVALESPAPGDGAAVIRERRSMAVWVALAAAAANVWFGLMPSLPLDLAGDAAATLLEISP